MGQMWQIHHALLFFMFCAFWIPWTSAVQLDVGSPGMFWICYVSFSRVRALPMASILLSAPHTPQIAVYMPLGRLDILEN